MTGPQPPPEGAIALVQVDITEELQLATLPEVRIVLDRVLSLLPQEVVIDLSGCRRIDAAAIGLLLDLHRQLSRRRAVLTVRNPNPRIRHIMQAARLDQVLPIVTTAQPTATAPDVPTQRPLAPAHGRAPVHL